MLVLQKLNLTIPQVYLVNQSRGFIPPELWDDGIVAGFYYLYFKWE